MLEFRVAKNVSYREVFYEVRVFTGKDLSNLHNSGTINLYPEDWKLLKQSLELYKNILITSTTNQEYCIEIKEE